MEEFGNWLRNNHLVFLSFLTGLRRQIDVSRKRIGTNLFQQHTDIYFDFTKENEEVILL
jgi:hypothetical protein